MPDSAVPVRAGTGWWSRFLLFCKKHTSVVITLVIVVVVFVVAGRIGIEPLQNADAAKQYILSFGAAAPLLFIGLQVLQVVIAPLPGQAAGLAGGFVFGWQWGILYTSVGLAIGSWIIFFLSRNLGRRFVERINGPEALKDFEDLFLPREGSVGDVAYKKSKESGLATFFMIMLLPALPDDLVCFVAGLTNIPIWKLMIATIVGRFPGMLALSLIGEGFSKAQSQFVSAIFIGVTVLLTLIYMWKKEQIEAVMRRRVGLNK